MNNVKTWFSALGLVSLVALCLAVFSSVAAPPSDSAKLASVSIEQAAAPEFSAAFDLFAPFASIAAGPRTAYAIAGACLLSLALYYAVHRSQRGRLTYAINIAEGTHKGVLSKKTDAAIATRGLLYKFGSDGSHIAACGAGDIPLGIVDDEASAAELDVTVELLGVSKRTMLMVASEALTVGEAVFTAANGKVQDLPAGAGTYYQVGYALNATAADGDIVEVQHCTPIKTVVT